MSDESTQPKTSGTEIVHHCPFCDGKLHPGEIPYCQQCQVRFRSCPDCGKLFAVSIEVCPHCGYKVTG